MTQLFTNNTKGTLNAGINTTATSIVLASGLGAAYPSPTGGDFFKITLTQPNAESSWEIACIVGRSTDTLTVGIPGSAAANVAGRGYDGTAAASWSAADKAELRLTAAELTNLAIHNATDKATPVDADEMGLWNSVTGLWNKVSFANLRAWIAGTFAAKGANADITSASAITGIGRGRNTDITISAAGAVTKPLQPCFAALVSANVANVTGDNTAYTVLFDSETFDVAANYAPGTGIFTAPVTGKYNFGGMLYVFPLVSGTTATSIDIITSNRSYNCRNSTYEGGYTYIPFGFPCVDMDAGDTAYVSLQVSNTTKTISIGGSYSRFAGHLVC